MTSPAITPTEIEIALEKNDVNKIKEFIKEGGNIYKELEKPQPYYYTKETLLITACKEKKTEVVEILLDSYERDYRIAEKFVSNEENKDFLLKYIFIAWSEEEISEVLNLSTKFQNKSKKLIVLLADRQECVLVPLLKDTNLLYKLYRNGLLNLGHLTSITNRLDIFKRMVAIGFPGTDYNYQFKNSECLGLIKYCVLELNVKYEFSLSATIKNIEIFEFLLEVEIRNSSNSKTDFLQKYLKDNSNFFDICIKSKNYVLLAHILTEYKIKINNQFLHKFLKEKRSEDYIQKIIESREDIFDDLLESIDPEINSKVLSTIWRTIDKSTLKRINKNNVKLIIIIYLTEKSVAAQNREFFNMVDPLVIYDEDKGNTALFIALELNCAPVITNLISKGANLLHKNKEGHTALTAACKFCTTEIVRLLLKAEPSLINEVGVNGYYPLTELIYRDDSFIDVFKKIIKKGANPHISDLKKNTLIHHAVLSENIEFVKVCLEIGVDPSIKDENDSTALHLSTKETLLEIFELILDTGKVDIETKNYRGNTILHNCCKAYFPYFFFSLIEKTKPNINALNKAGQSPIYYCYDNKRFKKLLEMGADTTIIGENNFPFYTAAAFEWRIDIVNEVLSNPDFDLTIADTYGNTLLHCLADMPVSINDFIKNENVKEMFRKCTNSVTIFNNQTAFQTAAYSSKLEYLKYMFEYSEPDLEYKTKTGETAIFGNLKDNHYHMEVLEYLIEKGADVNAQNDDGNSLIFLSVFPRGTEVLLKAGASTKLLNNKGESALHCAAFRNDLETCLLLLKYGADLNLEDENNKKPSDLCTCTFIKGLLTY